MDRSRFRNEDQSVEKCVDVDFVDVERRGNGSRSTINVQQAPSATGVMMPADRATLPDDKTGISASSFGQHLQDTHYVANDLQPTKSFPELILLEDRDKPYELEKHRQEIGHQTKLTSNPTSNSAANIKPELHEEFGDLLLEDFEETSLDGSADADMNLSKSALTKSSSTASDFEIVGDTDAEILTLQEDDFDESACQPLSHQLLKIADLLKSAAVTAESVHQPGTPPSVKYRRQCLPGGSQSTDRDSSETLHADCCQQMATLNGAHQRHVESLRAAYDSKLAAVRSQVSMMSPTAPCKNCQLTESRLLEKCRQLERQLYVVKCDFETANIKNKDYEDEISSLRDDHRKLQTLIQQLQRNASQNVILPSSAERLSTTTAAAAATTSPTFDVSEEPTIASVRKPSTPSASKSNVEVAVWACPRCTFHNSTVNKSCELCEFRR